MENKFSVIYSFRIKEGRESDFVAAWATMTQLIYQYEGSYGSRLHKADPQLFIAYAQWGSRAAWENSGGNLPEVAAQHRQAMRDCCSEIKTLYELETVADLLKEGLF